MNDFVRRTKAMARKELLHVVRDRRSLGIALVLPVMMLLMFGAALSLDVDQIPLLVYDLDRTAESRELINEFSGSRYFELRGYTTSYRDVEQAFNRGRVLMALVIPANYSENVLRGRKAEVQFLFDGSDSNTASIASGYAEAIARRYGAVLRTQAQQRQGAASSQLAPPIQTDQRVWYNASLESKNYVIPGLSAVILMIISALLSSMTIAREWEDGTMEQLLSTPVRPQEMVLGKMLAYFSIGAVNTLVVVVTGLFVFDVPFRGDVLFLAVCCCVFLTGAMFWGIFVSAVAKNQLLAFQMGILSSFLPSFLLSGFVYAIESMPVVVQQITRIVPARYFVTILKGIMLKGVGVEVLWIPLLFLLIYSTLVFFAASRKLRQKLV